MTNAPALLTIGTTPPVDTAALWLSTCLTDAQTPPGPARRQVAIAPTLAWEQNVVQEPSVWYHNGRWHMIHTGGSSSPGLGYAWAINPRGPWTKHTGPVLGQGTGGLAGGTYHTNVYVEGSTAYCYFPDLAAGGMLKVATADLSDPTTWTIVGTVMDLPPNSSEFGNTFLVKEGSTYYLFYECEYSNNWQIGIATATSPTGTFTSIQLPLNTLWPESRSSNVGGMWVAKENGQWVMWYHRGPQASVGGPLPTEIHRATSTDMINWTPLDNGRPVLTRESPQDVDQVADPFLVEAENVWYLFWEGFDNTAGDAAATIFASPLSPALKQWDGTAWTSTGMLTDPNRPTTAPQKAVADEATTNLSSNSTASYTTVFSTSFTPSGTAALVTLTTMSSNATGAAVSYFQVTDGTNTEQLGSFTQGTGQLAFTGQRKFLGLTPGTRYTFSVQVKVSTGTWQCRASSFPAQEALTLKVEDAAFP
jgi:hypothetical protein